MVNLPRHTAGETTLSGQLDEIASTLNELVAILDQDEGLLVVLERLAQTALLALDGADAVTVTVLDGTTPRTATATSPDVLPVDQVQYVAGEGPDLEAARTREPVRVAIDQVADRWPDFVAAARALGIRSYLSAPLVFPAAHERDAELVGSLNVYGTTDDAFTRVDSGVLRLLTSTAVAAVGSARRYLHTRELVDNLAIALTSRATIDQAKGILMARHGVDATLAFQLLVKQSQNENVKLAEVARQILESATGPR